MINKMMKFNSNKIVRVFILAYLFIYAQVKKAPNVILTYNQGIEG